MDTKWKHERNTHTKKKREMAKKLERTCENIVDYNHSSDFSPAPFCYWEAGHVCIFLWSTICAILSNKFQLGWRWKDFREAVAKEIIGCWLGMKDKEQHEQFAVTIKTRTLGKSLCKDQLRFLWTTPWPSNSFLYHIHLFLDKLWHLVGRPMMG